MTIDLEKIRWIADQTEEVLENVAPLVAALLNIESEKVVNFVNFVRQATESVLDALDIFLKFPISFGASGDGLTDEYGNACPDCPDCGGHEEVVFALKAQQYA